MGAVTHKARRPAQVVVNNGGCGIFSFLPIAAHADAFTPLFDTPHALSFAPLAAAFRLEYRRADSARALDAAYAEAQASRRHFLIEAVTDAKVPPPIQHPRTPNPSFPACSPHCPATLLSSPTSSSGLPRTPPPASHAPLPRDCPPPPGPRPLGPVQTLYPYTRICRPPPPSPSPRSPLIPLLVPSRTPACARELQGR